MRAVDTNALVRLVTRDDLAQFAAAEAFIESGAWVSLLAIAETVWVLDAVYERTAAQIVTAVEMLLHHTTLTLQDPEVVTRALDQFRKRAFLGFSECLLVEIARKAGHGPLATFDRALAKVERAQRIG
jgi:predicted nucleic-acid-binding protein